MYNFVLFKFQFLGLNFNEIQCKEFLDGYINSEGAFHLNYLTSILYTVCLFHLLLYFVFPKGICNIGFYMIYVCIIRIIKTSFSSTSI